MCVCVCVCVCKCGCVCVCLCVCVLVIYRNHVECSQRIKALETRNYPTALPSQWGGEVGGSRRGKEGIERNRRE